MFSLCHIPKEIISLKNFIETASWKLVPGPFVFPKNWVQPLLENQIFEKIFLYCVFNSKTIKIGQINMLASSYSFLQRTPWKLKEPGTNIQATFFIELFDKNFYFEMLHKLAKFHYARLCLLVNLFNKIYFVFHA